MPLEVHEDTDLYTIEYDPELDAIIHTWNEFAEGERFRSGANDLLAFIRQRDTSNLIVDTSGIRAHNEADKEWLETEWVPQIIDAGIRHAATVHKDSVISEMEMEEFVRELDELPYTAMMTADMSEAREWIAEQ